MKVKVQLIHGERLSYYKAAPLEWSQKTAPPTATGNTVYRTLENLKFELECRGIHRPVLEIV